MKKFKEKKSDKLKKTAAVKTGPENSIKEEDKQAIKDSIKESFKDELDKRKESENKKKDETKDLNAVKKNKFSLHLKVGSTPVIPVVLKIIVIFTTFIFVSNISTNFINLYFNRTQLLKLMKELIVKDLKAIFLYSNSQHDLYKYSKDLEITVKNIEERAKVDLKKNNAMTIGINEDGSMLFKAVKSIERKKDIFDLIAEIKNLFTKNKKNKEEKFDDKVLKEMTSKMNADSVTEDFIFYEYGDHKYFGVYKYNPVWKTFIVRGEEFFEFFKDSWFVFISIAVIISIITVFSSIIGIFLIRYILRYIFIISSEIKKMVEKQTLYIIDLKKASNDDVTYLGAAFNSLSSTINNIMNIFLKFVNRDIVTKAYEEKEVRLEGTTKELSILFSDIKGFTFMTEILGIDVIKLLNIHYEKAIGCILEHNGIIGSLIGDAVLAMFGTSSVYKENKSIEAVKSAYGIQEVTSRFRDSMIQIRDKIEKQKGGNLSIDEKRLFKAVTLEVGVGIDGGDVFYGNIGSNKRMTNTAIGDNVNAASRLEGLTRLYHVPVICSEFIKKDIEDNTENHNIFFLELDTVLVKGKTVGKRIYWPIFKSIFVKNPELEKDIKTFSEALQLYYHGQWDESIKKFKKCQYGFGDVFIGRINNNQKPTDWNGVWKIETK